MILPVIELGIGDNIKKLRKEKGLTQTDLAKKVGVTMQAISHYETNRANPSMENLRRIAATLGCSVSDLADLPADTPTEEQPPAVSLLERIDAAANKLNAPGQAVAADFVEGLAEVPKYQRGKENA
ncbi:helix-turn-helix transcriptional regulator [Cloacibacillus sp.]